MKSWATGLWGGLVVRTSVTVGVGVRVAAGGSGRALQQRPNVLKGCASLYSMRGPGVVFLGRVACVQVPWAGA